MFKLFRPRAPEALMDTHRGRVESAIGYSALQVQAPATSPREMVRERIEGLRQQVHWPFTMESVLPAMFKLAEQLNPHLAKYDLVVGDDTSGRLPALLYWRLVNARRKETGLKPAQLRFMSSKYGGLRVPDGMFPRQSDKESRALIVTEYVGTGASASKIYTKVQAQRGSPRIDVAALGNHRHTVLTLPEGSNFYTVPKIGPVEMDKLLYGSSLNPVKGVGKHQGDLHSFRLPPPQFSAQEVGQARADIGLIAEELYSLLPPVGRLDAPMPKA